MSSLIRCDYCKKNNEHDQGRSWEQHIIKFNTRPGPMTPRMNLYGQLAPEANDYELDLCPECLNSFKEMLKIYFAKAPR